jgi:hypothetical protein
VEDRRAGENVEDAADGEEGVALVAAYPDVAQVVVGELRGLEAGASRPTPASSTTSAARPSAR